MTESIWVISGEFSKETVQYFRAGNMRGWGEPLLEHGEGESCVEGPPVALALSSPQGRPWEKTVP